MKAKKALWHSGHTCVCSCSNQTISSCSASCLQEGHFILSLFGFVFVFMHFIPMQVTLH
jgi:hypothetical protein